MTPSPAPIYPAELLLDLVERFLAGSLWTREQRKDAWLLVSLLCAYSRDVEAEERMNTLERELLDDANDAHQATG